jgi:dehydrogenase/reductase SDR family protein 12
MYTVKLDVNDLQAALRAYDGTVQYAQAKRAQVMLTELWARRLAGSGVVVHAMHPGWAETPGVLTSLPDFAEKQRGSLRTPEQGADTAVWLAAAPAAAASSGGFWFDRAPAATHMRFGGTTSSPAEYNQLWQQCAQWSAWSFEGSPQEAAVKAAAAASSTPSGGGARATSLAAAAAAAPPGQ